uniref:Uncharacterized protein n=1 Tax=Manihot esculenta TaxID=3983 RepID=A0A2C9V3I7_MANES
MIPLIAVTKLGDVHFEIQLDSFGQATMKRKVVHITEASLMDPWKIQFSLIRYHPRSYWMCSIPLLHPNTKILIVAAGSCSPI